MQTAIRSIPVKALQSFGNVRSDVGGSAIEELAASIGTLGVLQPISVRRRGDGWQIVAGHRRVLAAAMAGVKSIPAYVDDCDESEVVARQLVENLQRVDLPLIDAATGVKALYEQFGSVAMTAEAIGKSRSYVSKLLLVTMEKAPITLGLVADDYMHDLDMAYTMAQIERLDRQTAIDVQVQLLEHATITREHLRSLLAQLKARPTDQAEEPADDEERASKPADAPKRRLHVIQVSHDELEAMVYMLSDRKMLEAGTYETATIEAATKLAARFEHLVD